MLSNIVLKHAEARSLALALATTHHTGKLLRSPLKTPSSLAPKGAVSLLLLVLLTHLSVQDQATFFPGSISLIAAHEGVLGPRQFFPSGHYSSKRQSYSRAPVSWRRLQSVSGPDHFPLL